MPYTIGMYFFDQGKDLPIPRNAGIPPWVSFPDVFDPAWVEKCHAYAQKTLAPFAKDPWLVGYFIDNEPNFAGWYEVVTRMPKDAPFRKAFVEVARKYYADKPGQLVKDWKTWNVTKVEDLLGVEGDVPPLPELAAVWQEAVAEQAFGTVEAAARKAAPNHLNLGTRMINAVPPSPAVFAAMGRHVDVISMNLYSLFSDRLLTQMFTLLPAIHAFTKKPIMTSEFTFRGGDTRCPNTIGRRRRCPLRRIGRSATSRTFRRWLRCRFTLASAGTNTRTTVWNCPGAGTPRTATLGWWTASGGPTPRWSRRCGW